MTPAGRIRVVRDLNSAPGRGYGEASAMRDRRDTWDGEPIKFGSFSLGDVFDSEIKKLGRFAFRERKSTGDAAAKFVEKFVGLQQNLEGDSSQTGETRGLQSEKEKELEGLSESFQQNRADPASPPKPSYPYGTCINHILAHSWSDPIGRWVWVRKGAALETAELGLGFPARREEVQRFGHKSSRVIRVRPRIIDERSFAEVASMDPGRGRGQMRRGGAAPRGTRATG